MDEYRVSLDVFEGPLDLLLRLIEREELDITLVSLAVVADQYLAHIAEMRELSAANLAEFVVIAARLVVIKSRVLLPRPEDEEDDQDEEWGEDLVERLREYKRFKDAALRLRNIEELGRHAYPRVAPPPQIERPLKPGEVTVDELIDALRRVLAARPAAPPVDDVVAPIVVRIGDCVRNIERMVRRYGRVRFSTVMRRARSRLEVIVTFLAMLEMIKQQRLRAVQERSFSDIYLEEREPDPGAEVGPIDPREYGETDDAVDDVAADRNGEVEDQAL
ncbi:MAG TPA: segregation/condensation protein A [Chloroflexi bacterium]|jgi:segregation and condensation protein A|nr:segregation/condensation protein A [Chloroflexota bacterium]